MDIRTATALLLLTATTAASAAGYESLGKDFAAAARAAGVSRVALGKVSGPPASRAAAERLLAALVGQKGIQVVEREQLPELMAERALAGTGAAEGPGPESRLAGAQAVVIGRYEELVGLSARLVAVESGVILAAGRVDGETAPAARVAPDLAVPAPSPLAGYAARAASLPSFAEPKEPAGALALFARPAAEDPDCLGSSATAERLEEDVLELKARYWAWQERHRGLDPRARPEEGIADPLQLALFRDRYAYWRAARRVPALDRAEVRRFVEADGRAFALRRACPGGRYVAKSGS